MGETVTIVAFRSGRWRTLGAVAVAIIAGLSVPTAGLPADSQSPAPAPSNAVTFAKDVAPILQAKCQTCHRPGSIAPASFLTYQATRPWARAIKDRVLARAMPPWHVSKTVGIQKYKNDRSLSDQQIETIVQWVDAGAPLGNPKDLPPPIGWPNEDLWTIGTPDLIVATPEEHVTYAEGPDVWIDYFVDVPLTEPRYIKAVETKPSREGRKVVHHAVTTLYQPGGDDLDGLGAYLNEYAVGKYGDIFGENTGRLLKPGAKIGFNMHYHAVGEEIRDRTRVAFVFYPKGYVPKYERVAMTMSNNEELDVPAGTVRRIDAYRQLTRAVRIDSWQPHMHMRGKAMALEAIFPNGSRELVGLVDRFDFNWHVAYVFADDVAPVYPAGTVLHTIAWHDNTAQHRGNPDPTLGVVYGRRSIDDMNACHLILTYLSEEDYQRLAAQRKARTTNNN